MMYYRVTLTLLKTICPFNANSGCGKREAHINIVYGDLPTQYPFETTLLRFTGPVPADFRQ